MKAVRERLWLLFYSVLLFVMVWVWLGFFQAATGAVACGYVFAVAEWIVAEIREGK